MNTRNITLFVLVLAAAMSRVIPHPWNFTALGALSLMSAAYFGDRRVGVLAPLAAMLISDLALGYSPALLSVYAPMFLISLLGLQLQGKVSVARVAGAAFGSSLLFFAISNFGVWAEGSMYPMTLEGLGSCYVLALPFLKNQVMGDLFFSAVLFGAFETLRKQVPAMNS